MQRNITILLLTLLMASCHHAAVETHHGASLQAIDSLMWQQPDSALAMMVQFAASPQADSLDEFDRHYCQLLISELLYKNDYGQTNRKALLEAVDYFDTLCCRRDAKSCVSTRQRRDAPWCVSTANTNVFLDARAHYIKGVGFYERDSLVEACAEYLKTLETMEEWFEEKELVKNKAKFMTYTYNRLGELFSRQFMMESAITCYKNSLIYCKIEPISSQSVSIIYFLIGKQYDKMNDIDKARLCYEQALEGMKNCDNLLYRDVLFCKTVSDYQVGKSLDKTMDELRQIVVQAVDEKERLNRFLTIGAIFKEEGIYDSALYYFDFVIRYEKDMVVKMRAAESMRSIYDKLGDKEKYDECLHFLALQKKSEGEDKALVSQLADLYQNYVKQKQEKLTEAEHTKHVKKIVGMIVPIAVLLSLAIIVVAKLRSKKLLKQQQEEAGRAMEVSEQEHEKELRLLQAEADKALEKSKRKHEEELETERKAYQQKQKVLRQSLQQREEQVNALEKAMNQQHEEAVLRRDAFLKEPICQHIFGSLLLHDKEITSRDAAFEHHAIALRDEDCKQLQQAVDRHYAGFDAVLLGQCTVLKPSDLTLCHLHLMGLSAGVIGALRSRTYSGIKKQNEALEKKLGLEESLSEYVLKVAEQLCSMQNEAISEKSTLKSTLKISVNGTLKGTQKRIVEIIIDNPHISIPQVARLLDLNPRGVAKHFKTLQDKGVIHRVGPDNGGYWEVID